MLNTINISINISYSFGKRI